ncbi:MAG: pyridoxal phosphate-dependent aminotransferase, partial [Desulfobacterales bacterium]|nr:pyridoxal phosphate-dependent aminotransferase [Desulfobacterales bacterium]
FTVAYPGMAGSDLVTALMRFGISAIALDATGSARQGVRACVSQIAESDFDIIAERLAHFQRVFV